MSSLSNADLLTYMKSTSSLEWINALSNIFVAVGTLLIAIFARIFQIASAAQEEARQKRSMLADASSKVDNSFAFLFFRSRMIAPGKSVMSGDVEQALNDHQYVYNTAAEIRVVVNDFLESLRACAHLVSDILPRSSKGGLAAGFNKSIFMGQYDPCTTKLRLGINEFARYYHFEHDGIREQKQAYFKRVFGNDEEWDKLCFVVEIFCPKEFWLKNNDEKNLISQISVKA